MNQAQFDFILSSTRQTRQNMLGIMESFSLDQLTHIPDSFNNNLLWNFGHVVITQQLLCYAPAGQRSKLDQEMLDKYRKGSAPTTAASQEELDQLIAWSTSLLDDFVADYEAGIFQEYKAYTTSYKVTLTNIDEAFQFNLAHEALHLGTMQALKKLV